MVGCFLSQVFETVPALYFVALQHSLEMAVQEGQAALLSVDREGD